MRFLTLLYWATAIVIGLPLLVVSVEIGGYYLVGHPPITFFFVVKYEPTSRFILHELPFMGGTFTRDKWREAGDCTGLNDGDCAAKHYQCPRGPMVHDLMDNHLIVGETARVQVESLLGAEVWDYRHDDRECIRQTIGMCSGLGIDYDLLYVCFDETGRVSDSWHWQH